MADFFLHRRDRAGSDRWRPDQQGFRLYSFPVQIFENNIILRILSKSFFWGGCAVAGFLGASTYAMWTEPFPVKSRARIIQSEMVKDGEDLRIGLGVHREKQCPITVMRRLQYADGSTTPIFQEIDSDFGPIGDDQYVLRVPTSIGAPHGKARMVSQACARCNVLHETRRSWQVCANEVVDEFTIGDRTILKPWPSGFHPDKELAAEPRR